MVTLLLSPKMPNAPCWSDGRSDHVKRCEILLMSIRQTRLTRLTSLFGAPNAPAELPTGRPPQAAVIGRAAAPPPPPEPKKKKTVEVVSGHKRTEEAIR